MQINTSPSQNTFTPAHANQTPSVRSVRSVDDWHPVDRARHTFTQRAQEEFQEGSLSKKGLELARATVAPNNPGAPGVQVSTFAVDGVQANDIVLTKRVPPTADGPNFVLYVPDANDPSLHEFKTGEELTTWVKEHANDPETRDKFAAHFAHEAAPNREARVKEKLKQFVEDDINVVVGSYAYERGDIFTRLDKDVTRPPRPVNGLTDTHFYRFNDQGDPTYKGYLADGKQMLYKYDAYGNLHGASDKNTFYFVRNGLNNNEPLEPISLKQYTRQVTAESLDNIGANNLSGLFHEFIRQLRNPGEGLGTALVVFGVPSDVAYSIEEFVKNPVKGTLVQLNHDNRLGKFFGVDKETTDTYLEKVGDELQQRIPHYGKARKLQDSFADILEKFGPPAPDTNTKVNTR
ncbi:dermonecrotic toxin domain-containing protein [Pseudomonas poae]|uniref:dermonecrotic toxin domain-containing protein n=1 Tax=Pseudomonas poae TaxID=200451 RepID=UPI0021575D6D|nr:DUF6543 domain-containing protein [Pseudomonas poae]